MTIIGVNIGQTIHGMDVYDGAAALMIDGKMVSSIAEERLTRRKHAPGFNTSVEYLLERNNLSFEDIDYCSISFFGQEIPENVDWLIQSTCLGKMKNAEFVIVPSHHLSHALTAYHYSGFNEALICIFDNEGNVIGEMTNTKEYWRNNIERASYFVGKDSSIQLHHRDLESENDCSVGDTYRQFTHFIGFHSMYYAGKTMGLSAYGDASDFKKIKLFSLENGKIVTHLGQDTHNDDWGHNVHDFFIKHRLNIGGPAEKGKIGQREMNIAQFVQTELERIICEKVEYLIEETGIRNICLGGGVALNVLLNSAILERTSATGVFVHPNCDDQGQGIGNCLYTYHEYLRNPKQDRSPTAFLGGKFSDKEIENAIQEVLPKTSKYEILTCDEDFHQVASLIYNNKIIGWFQGRSEIGPRALGHRSILANPCNPDMKSYLNDRVKFRENFRPFAPVSIKETCERYFDIKGDGSFMLFSHLVKDEYQKILPSITHVDGTARLQIVEKELNTEYYSLIQSFGKISGIDVLLNTSFNLAGQPIVESPEDALLCFVNSNLDALILHKTLIIKR